MITEPRKLSDSLREEVWPGTETLRALVLKQSAEEEKPGRDTTNEHGRNKSGGRTGGNGLQGEMPQRDQVRWGTEKPIALAIRRSFGDLSESNFREVLRRKT